MGTGRPYEQYFLAGPFLAGLKDGTYPDLRCSTTRCAATCACSSRRAPSTAARPGSINTKAHPAVARRVAQQAMVLLKNEPAVLPLDLAGLKTIAVIGDNAVRRFAAGGNAAGVKAFHETTALDGIIARVGGRADVVFSQGYRQPRRLGWGRARRRRRAHEPADGRDPRGGEGAGRSRRRDGAPRRRRRVRRRPHPPVLADDEGVDRRDLSLPANQDALIARIVEANPRTAVVLDRRLAGRHDRVDREDAGRPAGVVRRLGGRPRPRVAPLRRRQPLGQAPAPPSRSASRTRPAHAAGLARQFPGEGGKV